MGIDADYSNPEDKAISNLIFGFGAASLPVDKFNQCLNSIKQALASVRKPPVSVQPLDELAIQAETDMVIARLDRHQCLVDNVVRLHGNNLIDTTEARRLLGFKK